MSLLDELRSACPTLRENEPLSRHTSLAIGGPADFFADVNTRSELIALHRCLQRHPLPVFFLGAGSNVLVSDRGVRGLVLHLQGDFRNIVIEKDRVITGAGAWMPTLVKHCAEKGLSGIEFLIGVPGTIGGGLVMNAGTRDGALGQVVLSVDVIRPDGSVETLLRDQLTFDYRRSSLDGRWILGATLGLKPDDRSSIISRVDTLLKVRAQTQPLATNNCGSVFKNPPGQAAARLIEQAGLKGLVAGGARVSERHANFIINEKNARASDVQTLMKQIQQTVFDRFGIQLEPEVKLVGEWSS
ncbi:MAG: UDP-N-acetylmuramate dehydrogenase [Elusimicrobiota bacterium]|jgi:UDP-N-acetylmuramate dehydrogenase